MGLKVQTAREARSKKIPLLNDHLKILIRCGANLFATCEPTADLKSKKKDTGGMIEVLYIFLLPEKHLWSFESHPKDGIFSNAFIFHL